MVNVELFCLVINLVFSAMFTNSPSRCRRCLPELPPPSSLRAMDPETGFYIFQAEPSLVNEQKLQRRN